MGVQLSRVSAVTDIINKTVNKTVESSGQNCVLRSSNGQLVDASGSTISGCKDIVIGGNTLMQEITYKCLQTSNQASNFSSTIKEDIKKDLTSGNSGIGGIASVSLTESEIRSISDIINETDLSSMASCIMNTSNDQVVTLADSNIACADGGTLTVKGNLIQQKSTADCVQNSMQNAINKIDKVLSETTTAKATNTGIDLGIMFGLFLIIGLIALAVYFFIKKNPASKLAQLFNGGG